MKDNESQIMEAGYSMSPDMAIAVDSLMKQIEILGLSEVRLQTEIELHKAGGMELRARLHKIGDDRLEESVKHCTLQSENRELQEQVQELQAENKTKDKEIESLKKNIQMTSDEDFDRCS